MDFAQTLQFLQSRLQETLPGAAAQLRMSALGRFPEFKTPTNVKKSGVLILLYPLENEITTVFIKRPVYNGVHSGQVSFPGGKQEPQDKDLISTALREAKEEVGLNPDVVQVIGTLTELYIPPSGYTVLPVVGSLQHAPLFSPDPAEVDQLILLRVKDLKNPANWQEKQVVSGSWQGTAPCFQAQENIIWGATAMILNELLEILREIPVFQRES